MHFKWQYSRNGSPLKLVDNFIYLGSSISSTETDINTRLAKAWAAIDRLLVIWKSDRTDKKKHSFFQAAVMSIHYMNALMLTKPMEKKLDGNYTRMLRAILNKSWKQNPTKQQLYGHLHPSRKLSKLDEPDTWYTVHKWCNLVDPFTWPSKGRAVSSNLHTATLYRYGM